MAYRSLRLKREPFDRIDRLFGSTKCRGFASGMPIGETDASELGIPMARLPNGAPGTEARPGNLPTEHPSDAMAIGMRDARDFADHECDDCGDGDWHDLQNRRVQSQIYKWLGSS